MTQPEVPSADPERRIEAAAENYFAELQAGLLPDVPALLAAHSDIADRLQPRLALVERLFRAGQNTKAAADDVRQFPADHAHRLKCPHCGNGIQLVEPRPREVTCLNCGSSFAVDPEATASYRGVGPGSTIGRFEILILDLLSAAVRSRQCHRDARATTSDGNKATIL